MLWLLPARHLRRQPLHAVPERLSRKPAGRGKGVVMGPGRYDEGGGAADQMRLVLEALRWNWGEAYEIGFAGDLWYAVRRDGRGKLEESTVDGLRDAILADYLALPVPRDLPVAGDTI